MWSKSIFLTKSFWLNAIGIGLEIAQQLSGSRLVDATYLAEIIMILNIANRLFTYQPAHIMESSHMILPTKTQVNPNV